MNRITRFFGFFPSFLLVAGVVFKIMHWPGAGILITLSIAMLVLVYCPLWLVASLKRSSVGASKGQSVLVYFFMTLLGLSFLFKVQHWPGAGVLIYLSLLVALILIPVLWISARKQKDTQTGFRAYNLSIVFIVALSLVYFPIFVGPSVYRTATIEFQAKSSSEALDNSRDIRNISYELFLKSIADDTTLKANTAFSIYQKTNETIRYIADLKKKIIAGITVLPSETIDTMNTMSLLRYDYYNMDIPAKILWQEEGQKEGEKLSGRLKEYFAFASDRSRNLGVTLAPSSLAVQVEDPDWVIKTFEATTLKVMATLDYIERMLYHEETLLWLTLTDF